MADPNPKHHRFNSLAQCKVCSKKPGKCKCSNNANWYCVFDATNESKSISFDFIAVVTEKVALKLDLERQYEFIQCNKECIGCTICKLGLVNVTLNSKWKMISSEFHAPILNAGQYLAGKLIQS